MRWEEAAEAEGHTRLLRCTAEKVTGKLRAAAEAAARDRLARGAGSGGDRPELRGAARGREPQKRRRERREWGLLSRDPLPMWICPGGGGGRGGDREDARPAPGPAVGAAGALAVPRGPCAW